MPTLPAPDMWIVAPVGDAFWSEIPGAILPTVLVLVKVLGTVTDVLGRELPSSLA